jgi:hypothetical protein
MAAMTQFETIEAVANLLKSPAVEAGINALEVVHDAKGLGAEEVAPYVGLATLVFFLNSIASSDDWDAERAKLEAHGIELATVIDFAAAMNECMADLLEA